jgi:hypothetical protein
VLEAKSFGFPVLFVPSEIELLNGYLELYTGQTLNCCRNCFMVDFFNQTKPQIKGNMGIPFA